MNKYSLLANKLYPAMEASSSVPTCRRNRGWVYTDVVDGAAAGWTALDFYARRYTHSTRSQWQARLRGGQVQSAGVAVEEGTILRPGDRLQYHRPPWDEPAAPRCFAVVWDDGDLLVVDKPTGLQVLPAAQFLENTLLSVVRERHPGEPAPAHRLGRGTSGLVLFARSPLARRGLAAAFHGGRMRKVYRALVEGSDLAARFVVEQPIGRLAYPGMGYVFAATHDGKPSRSEVRVVEARPEDGTTLVEVEIPTGRPHQIRIHLAAAGHPLVGEPLYAVGGQPQAVVGERPARPGDTGYHLHAMQVGFVHPVTLAQQAVYSRPPPVLRVR